MKILLAVVGWLFVVAGAVSFLLAVSDGVGKSGNAVLVGPSATLIVAGAMFVLASTFAGHTNQHHLHAAATTALHYPPGQGPPPQPFSGPRH